MNKKDGLDWYPGLSTMVSRFGYPASVNHRWYYTKKPATQRTMPRPSFYQRNTKG